VSGHPRLLEGARDLRIERIGLEPERAEARFDPANPGNSASMLTLLLLVLLVVLLLGGIGPRYYRGRGRRTVVREYETDI